MVLIKILFVFQNFLAWGIPTLLVAILFMFDSQNITPSDKRNPSFQYGNCQAAISVFLHVMCFIGNNLFTSFKFLELIVIHFSDCRMPGITPEVQKAL